MRDARTGHEHAGVALLLGLGDVGGADVADDHACTVVWVTGVW
jgi:hypothetical protein